MYEIINFLNKNSSAIQAFFTFGIFIVTTIYVVFNSMMHKEMLRNREIIETPEISIRLEKISSGFHRLVIENVSNTTAFNLIFTKYPKLPISSSTNSGDIGFIKNGIKYLSSKQSYDSFFLNYPNLSKDIQESTIAFEIKYENKSGRMFQQEFFINLSMFSQKLYLGSSFEEELIEEIKGLSKIIKTAIEATNFGAPHKK
jgi:hypothetical protein